MIDGEYMASQYAVLFSEYRIALASAEASLHAFEEREQDVTGQSVALGLPRGFDVEECIATATERISHRLIAHAARCFAPESAPPLEIPEREFESHWSESGEHFDPQRLWDELVARFGGTLGHKVGYAQAASAIIKRFCLNRSKAIERVAGCAVLNLGVSSEQNGGIRCLAYGGDESLYKILQALNTFLVWAEAPPLTFYRQRGWPIRSRERIVLAPGVLDCITYYECFEFRLAAEIAEKLQVFLGLHGLEAWGEQR